MDNSVISLIIWPNGKTHEHCFTIQISSSIDTVKKLKEIVIYEKDLSKSVFERMKFYNHKEIEIDDSDMSYLANKQILYLSVDGSKFSTLNYVYEYEMIKPIKSGGFAEVYLAKHVLDHKLVSIKKTDLHNFSTEELYNISREAVYLSSLIHKNIIKMYSSYTYNDCLYNVMEYAEGGELTQILTNEKEMLTDDKIKNIFQQIHNAVKFIHSKNVIHRDLKTNNILFLDKERTQVVLIDFGISGICNGMSREVIKAGTLKYVPPELASGMVYQSSPKIDIWALGIILYLMTFKKFPFDGTDKEVANKIINEPLKFEFDKSHKIKKSLLKLIDGLLRKNPGFRIDINDPLFDEWYNDKSNDYANPKDYQVKEKLVLLNLFPMNGDKDELPKSHHKDNDKRTSGFSVSPKKPRKIKNILTESTTPSYLKPTSSTAIRLNTTKTTHINKSTSLTGRSKFTKK